MAKNKRHYKFTKSIITKNKIQNINKFYHHDLIRILAMANLYGLKKFDLNLLVIFECIYQHLSISRAAETLFITPSAVSQSLQRLRTQLNDPLFIRSGKGITPTQTSVNLHYLLEKT
jgi:predicted DNA-binding protein YlxM (UPF0122 family)